MFGPIIISAGPLYDIVGAFLVAVEVVKVFCGPMIIDIVASGTINGIFKPKVNPDFEKHEKDNRQFLFYPIYFNGLRWR